MKTMTALVLTLGLVAGQAAAGPVRYGPAGTNQRIMPAGEDRKDFQIAKDVAARVREYSWYSIFDDITVRVDHGVVTLTGVVTQPFKAADMAKRAAAVDGVKRLTNRIEALPVSQFDDELRYRIASQIYRNPDFIAYGARAYPPIHIVVKNGYVTLTGVVDSQVDKLLAQSLASFSGAFSVSNQLKTASEARGGLEAS
jgi:hyperosmotically inducible periplasmic protein